jgi:glycosyltransferase involved in cell wall biosynthesis
MSSQTNSVKVSVILTTYNSAAFVERAINSILTQTYPIYEIVVVDDASTDETISTVKKYLRGNSLKVIQSKHNMGPSFSRNKGLKYITGEFFAFMDSDDHWAPDRLAVMVQALNTSKSDVVYCNQEIVDNNGSKLGIQSDSYPMRPTKNEKFMDFIFKRNVIGTSAVLARSSIAKKVLFDETLRSAEDYDFWIRYASTGSSFHYIEKPLVYYRVHEFNISKDRELALISTQKVLIKNHSLARTDSAVNNMMRHYAVLVLSRLRLAESRAACLLVLRDDFLKGYGYRYKTTRLITKIFGKYPAMFMWKVVAVS